MQAVAYMRVSTKTQGKSGLGLESQKERIQSFLAGSGGVLVAEYVDVQSGSRNDRQALKQAIAHVKKIDGTLVIAKLDRISRRVSFIATLMESGIKFKVAEMSDATEFQLHIYAALAQEERRLISDRTQSALAAAKTRGVQLGKHGKVLAECNQRIAIEFVQNLRINLLNYGRADYRFRILQMN